MAKLESYDRTLSYSYAPGLFPATECLNAIPERCHRLLISSKIRMSDPVNALIEKAESLHVRVETADRVLERLSKKENCFAAVVYEKAEGRLDPAGAHIVLNEPSDNGNVGTIIRTALGMGYTNIAIIRPAVDTDDPRVVRASMGACFSVNIEHFDSFESYRERYADHQLYLFMLKGSDTLNEVTGKVQRPLSLVFGNEARGLPDAFAEYGIPVRIPHSNRIDSLNLAIAAGIGMYALAQQNVGHGEK